MKYGSFGALEEKLHLDEPVFVMRGQDILAPHAIVQYAALIEATAWGLRAVGATEQAERLYANARECRSFAAKMVTWQVLNPDVTKIPD